MLKKKFGDCISTYCVLRASQREAQLCAAAQQELLLLQLHYSCLVDILTFDIIARSFWLGPTLTIYATKRNFFYQQFRTKQGP